MCKTNKIIIESGVNDDPFSCNEDIFKESSSNDFIKSVYDGVEYLNVNNKDSSDIVLEISNDNNIYVQGVVDEKPVFNEGVLEINGLEGTLKLPNSDLKIRINSIGNITGDVVNKGIISTEKGSITLKLYNRFFIGVHAGMASTKIKNMKVSGNLDLSENYYITHKIKSLFFLRGYNKLILRSESGFVDVEYIKPKLRTSFKKYL
jgi:hypothetical protein